MRIIAHLVKNKTITEAVTILEHWYPHLKLSPRDISTLVSLNILRTDTDIWYLFQYYLKKLFFIANFFKEKVSLK